ncbi:MAG: metallo-beta-lactamase superfamily protein [Ramlibacter sp.]|nr:metallo-beta-lactamase superfamily protein [Ramlibacter sp.]
MPLARDLLPPGVTVHERGWLSANLTVIVGASSTALVDTGYSTHAEQTLALVRGALADRSLDTIVNTHLHSDHCGGNAALQAAYPGARTWIPPGQAAHVRNWDPVALSYEPTGQICPQFRLDEMLQPGSEVALGDLAWQVHAAPGHDPHSVVLFEPRSGALLSADALWENGFGIVFPELEGAHAFDEVEATLNLISALEPRVVVPGHGRVFTDVAEALARARSRLESFRARPARHAAHAAKVLLKFKLLEVQRLPWDAFVDWAESTPYFRLVQERWFPNQPLRPWVLQLYGELAESGAAGREPGFATNR